ncbi:hypothetical protein GCM10027037_13150 [Mucilaginibacter koreensis]
MKTSTGNEMAGNKMARRSFLQFAGAGALAVGALTATSCKKDRVSGDPGIVDIGSGDIGILNYAYALEQLEAAFYKAVIDNAYSGMSSTERSLLTDIRDHEQAHRDFFKAALGGSAIKALTPDFSSINFGDRNSVLNAAKSFEDLGVAAYNGAGYLIKSADYLTLAGKIVSVEARHAALIRDLIGMNSFVDNSVVTLSEGTSLERSKAPSEVVPIANKYVSGARLVAPAFGLY